MCSCVPGSSSPHGVAPPYTDTLTMRFRSILRRKELHKVVQHVQLWASQQLALLLFWLSRLDFMLCADCVQVVQPVKTMFPFLL